MNKNKERLSKLLVPMLALSVINANAMEFENKNSINIKIDNLSAEFSSKYELTSENNLEKDQSILYNKLKKNGVGTCRNKNNGDIFRVIYKDNYVKPNYASGDDCYVHDYYKEFGKITWAVKPIENIRTEKNESLTILENVSGNTLEESLKKIANKPARLKLLVLKNYLNRLLPVIKDIGTFKKRVGLHPKNIIIPGAKVALKILMPTYYSQSEYDFPGNLLNDFIYLLQRCLDSLGITSRTLYEDYLKTNMEKNVGDLEQEVNIYKKLKKMTDILGNQLRVAYKECVQIDTIPTIDTPNRSAGYDEIKAAIESL